MAQQAKEYSTDPSAVKSRERRKYLREYQRTWIKRRRDEWIAAHGPCAKCGSTDRLEVDHKDHKTKRIEPRGLWSMSPNNLRRQAELAKCQVLCHECHKRKSRPQLVKSGKRQMQFMKHGEGGRLLPGMHVFGDNA